MTDAPSKAPQAVPGRRPKTAAATVTPLYAVVLLLPIAPVSGNRD